MIDETVRLIALQFSFSNFRFVPQSVRKWKPEVSAEILAERAERKSRAEGTLILEPTENCSIVEFLGDLEVAGYELVDALYKERIDQKDPRNKKFIEDAEAGLSNANRRPPGRTYPMVRFVFARSEFVNNLFPGFLEVRDSMYADLAEMGCAALWRSRALSNPLYKDGEEGAGQSALSVNFEVRKPLFQPSGLPVVERKKDATGNPIGDPLPIEPEHLLRLKDGELLLEPFEYTI